MDYVKIGGIKWDVLVTSVSRNFENRQSDNAGETLAPGARKALDPLGTFIGHTVTFKRRNGKEAVFDALWDFVAQPRTEPIPVEIVYNQETLAYEAIISSGTQDLKKCDPHTNRVHWDELTLTFEPIEAQVKI